MQKRGLTFVVPCFNAAPNLADLFASLCVQQDTDWRAVFIDDASTDATRDALEAISRQDSRISFVSNADRRYALRNVVEVSRGIDGIVAVIDGDDQLINDRTVSVVRAAHDSDGIVAWTAHRWDVNSMNISREMPQRIDPYQYPWCSSHLRTFDAGLLKGIPTSNFQDHRGEWFKRGYDQALMLPLLKNASRRVYVPEVCYLYRINSCSIDSREWTEKQQLSTVSFVRARGYLDA